MQTSGEPDTTSQTGRQMDCYKGRQWRAGHHQPEWETDELLKKETNELEASGEPNTTSQTGRQTSCNKGRQMNWRHPERRPPPARLGQMNCYKGRQMNWRHPESRTPQARLGDKWIATRRDKWIGDIRRAGHHQPDWETDELLRRETNELETSGEPDTTSQTGRQMNCCKGRQMTWRHT